jgi:hypothetical protein
MFDDEILEEMIFANTLKEISSHVPDIPTEKSKTFLVAGNPINITGKEFIFGHVFNYANQLWSIISTQTKKYIDQSYFNQLVKEGETYIASLLEEIIYLSMAYVHKNGNVKISKSMKKRFFDLCDYAEVAWEPVYVAASEFQDLHQALAERRALSKKARSGYWVGGGFGIKGAIKGKIKADILNAGGAALNSAGNAVRTAIQAGRDYSKEESLKNELMQSWQFIHAIMVGLKQFLKSLVELLLEAFCETKDRQEGLEIYEQIQNYSRTKVKKTSLEKAIQSLNDHPFDIDMYANLYAQNSNCGAVLSEMASFCSVQSDVYSLFVEIDEDQWGEEKFDLDTIGIDIGKPELLKIKSWLISVEESNPAYLSANFRQGDVWAESEHQYHEKINALLMLHAIMEASKELEQDFSKKDIADVIETWANHNDEIHENILLIKLLSILEEQGTEAFLNKIGDNHLFPIVAEAILIHNHHLESMKTAALAGRIHVMAHWGHYQYKQGNRSDGEKWLLEAAKRHDYLGIAYLSEFFRKGIGGMRGNSFYSDLCLKIATAYGKRIFL